MGRLQKSRLEVAAIDRRLLELLEQRATKTLQIEKTKSQSPIEEDQRIVQNGVQDDKIIQLVRLAKLIAPHLDQYFVTALFHLIMTQSIKLQLEQREAGKSQPADSSKQS